MKRWTFLHAAVVLAGAVAVTASLGAAAPSASANPDCGNMVWKGKTYWFSAGGVSCARGRVLMRRYLDHNIAPAGYQCSKRYAPSCWHRRQNGTFLKLTTPH